ncbi:MAG: hypothetical protein KGI06_06155, partial [Candidatus Micrarchaeota archaeon]|nr:hypothetical protein [Candidatus Micrarchaeota archaeon]
FSYNDTIPIFFFLLPNKRYIPRPITTTAPSVTEPIIGKLIPVPATPLAEVRILPTLPPVCVLISLISL